ncbi:MAG: SHOCT domain-containing protein [bacterium]|nr:SHOCT domain-containing protein [bacterium]
MFEYYGDHMFGLGIWGAFMMLIFWVAVTAFIVWVVKEANGRNTGHRNSALDILKERYAKGEMSKEEFESMKKDIS